MVWKMVWMIVQCELYMADLIELCTKQYGYSITGDILIDILLADDHVLDSDRKISLQKQ